MPTGAILQQTGSRIWSVAPAVPQYHARKWPTVQKQCLKTLRLSVPQKHRRRREAMTIVPPAARTTVCGRVLPARPPYGRPRHSDRSPLPGRPETPLRQQETPTFQTPPTRPPLRAATHLPTIAPAQEAATAAEAVAAAVRGAASAVVPEAAAEVAAGAAAADPASPLSEVSLHSTTLQS